MLRNQSQKFRSCKVFSCWSTCHSWVSVTFQPHSTIRNVRSYCIKEGLYFTATVMWTNWKRVVMLPAVIWFTGRYSTRCESPRLTKTDITIPQSAQVLSAFIFFFSFFDRVDSLSRKNSTSSWIYFWHKI